MLASIIAARLLALDTLLPGQSLRCDGAPDAFRGLVERSTEPLLVVGRSRLTLHSRGVEVCTQSEGGHVLLKATGRLAEISDDGQDEGSRWAGRAGQIEWLGRLEDDDLILSCNDDLEAGDDGCARLGDRLGVLSDEWVDLVRSTRRERWSGQLDTLLDELGPMPRALNARAVHCAALINPQPALGVALEVRPAVLTARTTARRLAMAEQGLVDSIARLRTPGPCF